MTLRDVFIPVSLNLSGNPIVGKGCHAGNVRRRPQVIADLKKIASSVMSPITFEDIKVFLNTDEDSPSDIPAAQDMG